MLVVNNQCRVTTFFSASPLRLCDSVQFVLAALTERVPTNPRSPAPAPAPAPAPRLPVLLLGRQQEHHADGHQDVPQRVRVVVVFLRLGENEQTHPDQGAQYPGDQVEDPALPRRWVTLTPPHPSVHLWKKQEVVSANLTTYVR